MLNEDLFDYYGNAAFGATKTSSWSPAKDDIDAIVGDEDLIADLRRELDQDELDHLRLSIDDDIVELSDDPETQALMAIQLDRYYDECEDGDDETLKKRDEHLDKIGAREFGFERDEDNVAVTKRVDEVVDWYNDALQDLKDEVADKMREHIDKLRDDGIDVSGATKDLIYADLVDSEVIEQWEPLLF